MRAPGSLRGLGALVVATSAVLFFAPAGAAGPPTLHPRPVVIADLGAGRRSHAVPPAPASWGGFGINWTGLPYRRAGGKRVRGGLGSPNRWQVLPWSADQAQLAVDESRLLELHPAFVRMGFAVSWFDPTGRPGRYEWTSVAMEDRYIDLAFLARHGISVLCSMAPPSEDSPSYGSTSWTEVEADLLTHLVTVEGFKNIRGFSSINEPNADRCPHRRCTITMADWERASAALGAMLRRRHLNVSLLGPTVSPGPPWTSWGSGGSQWPRALSHQRVISLLGEVDWHEYLWASLRGRPPSGGEALRTVLTVPVAHLTAAIVRSLHAGRLGAHVKTLVSEFGFANTTSSTRDGVPSYRYAMALLDFGISLAQSGVGSAAVWELDPDVVRLDVASDGLWRSSPPFTAYPVLRAVGLLTRAAPPGSTVEPVAMSAGSKVRVLATRSGPRGHESWSILLANNTTAATTVRLEGLGAGGPLDRSSLTRRPQTFGTPITPEGIVEVAGGQAEVSLGPLEALVLTERS